MRYPNAVAFITTAVVLAACGGGGGSGLVELIGPSAVDSGRGSVVTTPPERVARR